MSNNIHMNKKQLIKKLRPYWVKLEKAESRFFKKVRNIEKEMQEDFNEKEIEFFWVDGEPAGIGTPSHPKKMKLIHDSELR